MSVFAPVFVMMPVSVMCVFDIAALSVRFAFRNNARLNIPFPSLAMRIVKRTVATATRTIIVFHF